MSRASSEPKFKLSRDELARIRVGNYEPLTRKNKPKYDVGAVRVLNWSVSRRTMTDGKGNTCPPPPREALLEIEVTQILRKAKGGWTVHFMVRDRRNPGRFLRPKPPLRNADWDKEPPAGATEEERARQESHYQSTPAGALDEWGTVSDEDLEGFAADAAQTDLARAKSREIERRQLPAEDRLRLVRHEAEQHDVDLSRQIASIEARLDAAENKVRRLRKRPSANVV